MRDVSSSELHMRQLQHGWSGKMIKFSCPVCHQNFDVDDVCTGMEVNCTTCGAVIVVPNVHSNPQADDRMSIKFRCANCGHHLKLEPQFAGKRVICSGCRRPLVVPTSSGFRWAFVKAKSQTQEEIDYSL